MASGEIYFGNVFEVLLPLEEQASSLLANSNFTIGIAKEDEKVETRVGLTPNIVAALVQQGFRVLVENDAGKNAHYPNTAYADAGAEIIYDSKEVFQTNMLFKIQAPKLEEIEWMKRDTILFSSYTPYNQTGEYFQKLGQKKITAIGYEQIKDERGSYPFAKAMSEIAGHTLFTVASECFYRRRGALLGNLPGVPAAKVVILGAGNVALTMARLLTNSGCRVEIFDNSIHRLHQMQMEVSRSISTTLLYNTKMLEKSVTDADIVITAIHSCENISPCVISEEMVKQMREGAILLDVSINQGGCVETSEPTTLSKPFFSKYGIVHYCLPNIPTLVPNTASLVLSNTLVTFLKKFYAVGNITALLQLFPQFRPSVYVYKGTLTDRNVAAKFGFKYQDINLLLQSRLG